MDLPSLIDFQLYQEKAEKKRFLTTPGRPLVRNVMYSYVRECVYNLLTFLNYLFLRWDVIPRPSLFSLIHRKNSQCLIPLGEIDNYLDILTDAGLITYIPHLDSYISPR